MKQMALLMFALFFFHALSPLHAQEFLSHQDLMNAKPRQIKLSYSSFSFDGEIDFDCEYGHLGKLVKSTFDNPAIYTFFDKHHVPLAQAIIHFHHWDHHFKPVSQMDIFNQNDRPIGQIDSAFFGKYVEYFLYSSQGNLVGQARGDYDKCSFYIYHPLYSNQILAQLSRYSDGFFTKVWLLEIFEPNAIDTTMLLYFGALVSHNLVN